MAPRIGHLQGAYFNFSERNQYTLVVKDLAPSVQSSKFLKMDLHHLEPKIFFWRSYVTMPLESGYFS